MSEATTQITLIGTKLARIGMEIIFNGPAQECENCKLRNSCTNLEPGRRYRVLELRGDLIHECPIHEDGVIAVEVTESPIIAAIDARKAFAGSKTVLELPKCGEYDCLMYDLCHPIGLKEGDRCTIVEIVGEAPEECSLGHKLKLVELRR
ncbi:MAG: UPF0179 family protein [Methanotrichaceae archaeon]